jgi:hypothetical protein
VEWGEHQQQQQTRQIKQTHRPSSSSIKLIKYEAHQQLDNQDIPTPPFFLYGSIILVLAHWIRDLQSNSAS